LRRGGLESGVAVARNGILKGHPGPPPAFSVSRTGVRVAHGPSRKHAKWCELRNPHLPEVDRRVAGLPSLQEPLDRRVKGDRVQLANVERAMTTNRVVLRRDVLERSGHVGRENHVHDVLAFRRAFRRDRVDQCDRPLERYFSALWKEPRLLP